MKSILFPFRFFVGVLCFYFGTLANLSGQLDIQCSDVEICITSETECSQRVQLNPDVLMNCGPVNIAHSIDLGADSSIDIHSMYSAH